MKMTFHLAYDQLLAREINAGHERDAKEAARVRRARRCGVPVERSRRPDDVARLNLPTVTRRKSLGFKIRGNQNA